MPENTRELFSAPVNNTQALKNFPEKNPALLPGFFKLRSRRLNIRGLLTLGALRHFESDLLAFLE